MTDNCFDKIKTTPRATEDALRLSIFDPLTTLKMQSQTAYLLVVIVIPSM